jgi:cytochrome c-type biogenesis protein
MELYLLLWLSFLAGIFAPLGSPCVLIIYPGYLAFLAIRASEADRQQVHPGLIGTIVSCGILVSLLAGGFVFSALVRSAGGPARDIITPAIYSLLLLLSLLLIFDTGYRRMGSLLPLFQPTDPLAAAFLYGCMFGIIILPCNAAALVVLLALAASATGFWAGMGAFLLYGIGVTIPLLILAFLSRARSDALLQFLSGHQRAIRVIAGLFMMAIALWYLALIVVPGVAG